MSSEKSAQSQSLRMVQGTHSINKNIDHDTSRPTLRSWPAPMQFTSPHPAPDWPSAVRASDDLALQRAPSRTARPSAPYRRAPARGPFRSLRPAHPAHPAPHARPTSGESRTQIILSRYTTSFTNMLF